MQYQHPFLDRKGLVILATMSPSKAAPAASTPPPAMVLRTLKSALTTTHRFPSLFPWMTPAA